MAGQVRREAAEATRTPIASERESERRRKSRGRRAGQHPSRQLPRPSPRPSQTSRARKRPNRDPPPQPRESAAPLLRPGNRPAANAGIPPTDRQPSPPPIVPDRIRLRQASGRSARPPPPGALAPPGAPASCPETRAGRPGSPKTRPASDPAADLGCGPPGRPSPSGGAAVLRPRHVRASLSAGSPPLPARVSILSADSVRIPSEIRRHEMCASCEASL